MRTLPRYFLPFSVPIALSILASFPPIGSAQVDLDGPHNIPAGESARLLAAGDVDGDGTAEIFSVDPLTTEIRMWIDEGSGYRVETVIDSIVEIRDISLFDANLDGTLDIVLADPWSCLMHAGLGGGTFAPTATFLADALGYRINFSDFNGDGLPDAAGTRFDTDTVGLSLGTSPGSFAPPITAPTGNGPVLSAAGDFNGDGTPEILSYAQFDGQFWLHRYFPASGILQQSYVTGGAASDFAVADFDSDGFVDVAVAVSVVVQILWGDPVWPLVSNVVIPTAVYTTSVEAADADGDGYLDLLVPDEVEGGVRVSWGGPGGTFAPFESITVGGSPTAVAVIDLDGSGAPDLVVGKTTSSPDERASLSFHPSSAPRQFGFPSSFDVIATPAYNHGLVGADAADLDGDGVLDLVCSIQNEDEVRILRGLPGGGFALATTLTSPTGALPIRVLLAHFDGDGVLDLAVSEAGLDQVVIRLGSGLTFGAPSAIPTANAPGALAAADFDDDGDQDLFCMAQNVTACFLGDGLGGFVAGGPTINAGLPGWANPGVTSGGDLVIEDIDADGDADVMLTLISNVRIYRGNGAGGLMPGSLQSGAVNVRALALGDATGDGIDDLVGVGDNSIYVWPTLALGLINTVTVSLSGRFEGAAIADFDADGVPDIAVSDPWFSSVSVLRGTSGTPAFAAATRCDGEVLRFGTHAGPRFLFPTDLDADGDLDLHVVCAADRIVTLENSSAPSVDCDADGMFDHCALDLGLAFDVDGDGIPDHCLLPFRRGDTHATGEIDIGDPIRILEHLFLGAPAECQLAFDVNDDESVDVADAQYALSYLFVGGVSPPAPFLDCGIDPTPGALGCADSGCP